MVEYSDIHPSIVHKHTMKQHRIKSKDGDLIILLCGLKRRYTQFTYDLEQAKKGKCNICFVTSIYTEERVA